MTSGSRPFPSRAIPFGAADQIARAGKGRDPLVILSHSVPTDMIDMQMGAYDVVDRLAAVAKLLQVLKERELQLVPFGVRAHLVVADTGIDDDSLAHRLEHQRMDAQFEPPHFVRKRRIKPIPFLLNAVSGGVRQ